MPESVAEPDLNDTDDEILVVLSHGRNVPSNLADEVDKSRQYIHQRLKLLETADYVRNVGNGVYELQPGEVPGDELDRLGITTEDVSDLRAERQAALEARDDAQARADRLADRVDDLETQLADARAVDVDALRRAAEDLEAACERGDGDAVQAALDRLREAIVDA